MNIYYPLSPDETRRLDTQQLRSRFLEESLFAPGEINAAYALEDRMILFGAVPTGSELSAEIAGDVTGTKTLLSRREIGIINVGGTGQVESGGKSYNLSPRHCVYLGKGSETPRFSSQDPENPARFYAISVPAHTELPPETAGPDDAELVSLGSPDNANQRDLYKYIHPNGIKSCQLVMGFTVIRAGSVWNTMPPHTHLRRTEAYLYFDLPSDQVVMHFMGKGDETRHLVVRNNQAVLSPSWSIHGGAGTASYAFVWAMAGENQDFTDMDHLSLSDLA